MVALSALWLPIVLAAVVCFVAAFVQWVVLPHHNSDWVSPPEEDAVMAALREASVGPGNYAFPHTLDAQERKSDAYKEKVRQGPAGFLLIWPAEKFLNMGPQLVQVFIYYLVVSLFVAYIGSVTLAAGADYLMVFRVLGTAAILAYSAAVVPKAIFFGYKWSSVWKEVVDGVVLGLLTAGVFGSMWPPA